ncbi:MAG: glucose 1-dehydrogenase [Rhodocyclaceae bacterium]|jgi:NAD(P)-dependent dehydrogenase (short-subunit alcohol dehydrogenase family)|nr:glucose 1-dehydrogenase [Rhodocyclaceae bacterium]
MNGLFDLTGKVALVTGATRGLGYEIALAYARAGADIVVSSRKAEACEKVAAEIRALGRKALAYPCHVGHWDEIEGLVQSAYDTFGKVDILVNNAGMSPPVARNADVTEELFDKVLGVNFKGPYRLSTLICERMAAGNGGCVINISSAAAERPQPTAIPYSGSKAALNAITLAMAQNYGPKVRVNCIMAGPFLTDIAKAWTQETLDSIAQYNAVGRPGQPPEIVTMALCLASPASGYTTGALIRVDGGIC